MAKEKRGYEIKKISESKNPKVKELFEGQNQSHDSRKVETSVLAENLRSYENYLQRNGNKKKAG